MTQPNAHTWGAQLDLAAPPPAPAPPLIGAGVLVLGVVVAAIVFLAKRAQEHDMASDEEGALLAELEAIEMRESLERERAEQAALRARYPLQGGMRWAV